MRFSKLFGRTLRDAPSDAEMISHKLAMRAALIRPLAAGLYTYMPLGWLAALKIMNILRQEMNRVGCQEMRMPVVHPAELWQATGRWDNVGPALCKLKDRRGRDYALAMTHEEVVAHLAAREVDSYRQMPMLIYHMQTKVRDEPRPRGGLIRVREFIMKDAYSLDVDAAGLDASYDAIYDAYIRVFERCGCAQDMIIVEADTGMMGGAVSHEFMLPHPQGEDVLILCKDCGYAANRERAEFKLDEGNKGDELTEAEPVATPDCKTIADVAAFVGVPESQTLKVVFYVRERVVAGEPQRDLVFALLRGDLDINETKLLHILDGGELRAATDDEISAVGAVPGYASPRGVTVRPALNGGEGVIVVADRSIEAGANFVAGANREGYHLTGVNYPRDFDVTVMGDFAQAAAGHICPRCGARLAAESAIEMGHTFKLGTWYSEATGATYYDEDGQSQPIVMGSYGIGVGRLLAAIIESHHDEYGIVWPKSVAPLQIHLLYLGTSEKDSAIRDEAEALYQKLLQAGFEVLYDDRAESAGVKFTDADLIGLPLRITVSRRSHKAGGVEIKWRWEKERQVVPYENLMDRLQEWFKA